MRRIWATAAIYTICSLAGALLGRGYYLINPILIIDHIAFADMRHLGAILGAVGGAGLAVILRHYIAGLFVGFLPQLILGSAFIPLGYLLCVEGWVLGLSTIGVLALPWFIVLLQNRSRSFEPNPIPGGFPRDHWARRLRTAGSLTGVTNDDTHKRL